MHRGEFFQEWVDAVDGLVEAVEVLAVLEGRGEGCCEGEKEGGEGEEEGEEVHFGFRFLKVRFVVGGGIDCLVDDEILLFGYLRGLVVAFIYVWFISCS